MQGRPTRITALKTGSRLTRQNTYRGEKHVYRIPIDKAKHYIDSMFDSIEFQFLFEALLENQGIEAAYINVPYYANFITVICLL